MTKKDIQKVINQIADGEFESASWENALVDDVWKSVEGVINGNIDCFNFKTTESVLEKMKIISNENDKNTGLEIWINPDELGVLSVLETKTGIGFDFVLKDYRFTYKTQKQGVKLK